MTDAICPLHGRTSIVGTNAYGFPIYACCCDDIGDGAPPDACAREPARPGDASQPAKREPANRREERRE